MGAALQDVDASMAIGFPTTRNGATGNLPMARPLLAREVVKGVYLWGTFFVTWPCFFEGSVKGCLSLGHPWCS